MGATLVSNDDDPESREDFDLSDPFLFEDRELYRFFEASSMSAVRTKGVSKEF